MKKSSKRILVSVLTLVLTVVALTTTTFAWFSLSSVSSVSGIEGKIVTEEGLEVALTTTDVVALPSDFQSNLNSEHFATFIKDNAANLKFGAVTSKDNALFTKLGLVEDKLTLGLKAHANKDYLEFKLTFRSKTAGNVKLDNYSFEESEIGTFKPEIPFVQKHGATALDKVVATKASYGARLSLTTGQGVDDYKAYQEAESLENTASDQGELHGQWSFLQSKTVYIYEEAGANRVTDPTSYKLVTTSTNNSDEIVTLEKKAEASNDDYAFGETIVRIWIEGWDADTYDSIFGLKLAVSMTFKKD